MLKPGATAGTTTSEPHSHGATINPVYGSYGRLLADTSSPTNHRATVSLALATAQAPVARVVTDSDGYEIPDGAAPGAPGGGWMAVTPVASYEIPFDPVLYGAPTPASKSATTTSVAGYEIPFDPGLYEIPWGADTHLYATPTPVTAPPATGRRPSMQRPPGGSGGGIQRNTTNRKPSQYDGFGGTAGLPNNRKAGEPEYVHPDSVTELVDYSRMESAQSNC